MKKALDRVSVIEDALSSFEWISRMGVWTSFVFAGFSFHYWAGSSSREVFLSYFLLAAFSFPLEKNKENWVTWFLAALGLSALLGHLFSINLVYPKIPAVLLFVPCFLVAEHFRTLFLKSFFVLVFWLCHALWSQDSLLSISGSYVSVVGAIISFALLFAFSGLQEIGKKRSSKKLQKLLGRNDFRSQRVHASRLQILGELSAALIHELSNPLTNLQGFFSQLLSTESIRSNVATRDLSFRIEANIARMQDLVLGFRSFSRMQSTSSESFSFVELFKDLELLSAHAFKLQGVELEICPAPEDIDFKGKRVEVGQIMMNFLLNALSATKSNKKATHKKVKMGWEFKSNFMVLYVEDSGLGVKEEEKAKVFRPFFSTKGEEGTGLGLYISKIIAEHHDCEIQLLKAYSEALTGARFELLIPQIRLIAKKDLKQVA